MAESEAALRGYMNPKRARQLRARQGWKRRRREGYVPRGRMVGHGRDRQEGLALAYRVQQLSREAFVARFEELRERQGVQVSERGLETRWQLYLGLVATYRAKRQDFKTTNCQRAVSLQARGRPRSVRTVQRARIDLAAMGLLSFSHVRRGGARIGNRDCLRCRLLGSFVTPPSAAQAEERSSTARAPVTAGCAGREHRPAAPARAGPPNGGSVGCADDQLQHPGGGAASAAEIAYLEAQLALPFEERSGEIRNTVKLGTELAWARFKAANPGWADS